MMLFFPLSISFFGSIIAWVIFMKIKNPGIIDVFWPINICAVATTFLLLKPWSPISTLAVFLCLSWGIRLSLFLLCTRVLKSEIEKRYQQLVSSWTNKTLGFLAHCLLQGFLAWILALPFYFIAKKTSINALDLLFGICILLSISGEVCADMTLKKFKHSKKEGVCQQGLWQYSRHPNCFFECMIWLGISLLSIFNLTSLFSLLSPLTLFFLMWFFTIPITESQSLKKRGVTFENYQKEVSCFIPWKRNIRDK